MYSIRNVDLFSPELSEVYRLQKEAFPPQEQYPFPVLLALASGKDVSYQYLSFNSGICALLFYSITDRAVYLFYLAVKDSCRGKGIGSRLLSWLREKAGRRPIYLNIDPVDERFDDYRAREKRLLFYQKNGFSDTGFMMTDRSGTYQILSSDGAFDPAAYKKAVYKLGMWLYRPVVRRLRDED